jgi:organic radical activating enzyme
MLRRFLSETKRLVLGRPPVYPRMSLYVISACSLACAECIMQYQMKARQAYQMSLEEIQELIDVSSQSRYKFNFTLTGGEPLLWKNLNQGVRMLRESSITNSIQIFSNVTHIHQVNDQLIDDIDCLRISQYPTNKDNTRILKEKYPEKVQIAEREEFWPNPETALENVLPARCANPEVMLFEREVYACPHSLSIALHHNVENLKLAEPLKPGFMKAKEPIRRGQEEQICTRCISNLNVRDQTAKVHNEAPFQAQAKAKQPS